MDKGTWWATQSTGLQEMDTTLWLNHQHLVRLQTMPRKETRLNSLVERNQAKKGKMWDSVLLILVTSTSHHTEKMRRAERDGSR